MDCPGQEGEYVYSIFHQWVAEALAHSRGRPALLVDLHGHGHPHDYIEIGLGLSTKLLNEISHEKAAHPSKLATNFTHLAVLKSFSSLDSELLTADARVARLQVERDWTSVLDSAVRKQFTMRHLLRRRFGSNNESVKENLHCTLDKYYFPIFIVETLCLPTYIWFLSVLSKVR